MTIATKDFYPLILDSIAEGVFTVDRDFRITFFNTAAEAITGFSREQAHGCKCYEIFRANVCRKNCPMQQSLDTEEPQHNVEVNIMNIKMKEVPIRVSCAVLRDQTGKLTGGVEIFSDISEVEALRDQLSNHSAIDEMIGNSPAMREIGNLIPDLAASDASVLILGASGTGKELAARAIHDASPRSGYEFVRINCGALPDTLLESELFGCVRGAFTDARKERVGRFQQAHKGTLFLDEVGDLSPAFQVKLLRVLQDGEFQPLGSTKTQRVDVRVVAATNRDLRHLIEANKFREDLYYRICVFPISIPPLRERREDILPLLKHYMSSLETRTGKKIREISPEAMAALYDYDYPGNVRQLINILERAFILCHTGKMEMAHLPPEVATPSKRFFHLKPSEHKLSSLEKESHGLKEVPCRLPSANEEKPQVAQLKKILHTNQWNRGVTADVLGISRSTLWRRMKEYGLVSLDKTQSAVN